MATLKLAAVLHLTQCVITNWMYVSTVSVYLCSYCPTDKLSELVQYSVAY